MGSGILHVLGDESMPIHQVEGNVEIVRFRAAIPNFLARTLAYGNALDHLLEGQPDLELCHFRDPWSGGPILARPDRRYRTIYEVNGLPSIEIPDRYPRVGPSTLTKIRELEDHCLVAADRVVCPAETIRRCLLERGVPDAKIRVIPNGAFLPGDVPRPEGAPVRYLVYVGALQRWQGVATLLKAFALLRDLTDLTLVIGTGARPRFARELRRLAARLGIEERIEWRHRLHPSEVASWLAHAELSVAPLADCPRNVRQGCCPLKILESMAVGTPVVASDLPAVREIVEDGVTGRLVVPDRPSELARAIRLLLEYDDRRRELGRAAHRVIEERFSWERSNGALRDLYHEVLDAIR
jgi:glycosyltransferase involved in cell wall biosynthesis